MLTFLIVAAVLLVVLAVVLHFLPIDAEKKRAIFFLVLGLLALVAVLGILAAFGLLAGYDGPRRF